MKHALLIGLGLSLVACRGNKSSEPPVHLIQNMDFQQSYKPQEANPWFLDGRSTRPLPSNVVAHGNLKADKALHEGRGENGRLLDGLPSGIDLNESLLARGEARYNIYCAPCHAKSGYGDGIVVARGLKVPPPSYHTANLKAMPLGYFYEVITKGKGTMMPYAAQMSQNAQLSDVPDHERQNLEGGR
jgi:mono/diheme cytochrome c family protein